MKRILKYALLLAFLTAIATLASCTLHDDQWQECIPLPETDLPVEPEPWEPGGVRENPAE